MTIFILHEGIVVFNVQINDLRERHTTKVDEAYLKKNNFKSFDELKQKLKENMISQYKVITSEITKKELLDDLEKNHTFDLPDGIISDEIKLIWTKVESAKQNGTLDPDDLKLSDKELKNRYEKIRFQQSINKLIAQDSIPKWLKK